jgi:hypothetical protein
MKLDKKYQFKKLAKVKKITINRITIEYDRRKLKGDEIEKKKIQFYKSFQIKQIIIKVFFSKSKGNKLKR